MPVYEEQKKSCEVPGGREQKQNSASNGVWLMTLHASKGLEFSHVFIIGVNYGLIPLHPSGFDEEEEERRLFYVGMTRARDYLELSYYTQPSLPKVVPGESRYLQMIPEQLVERVENNTMTDTVNMRKMMTSDAEEQEEGPEEGSEEESEEESECLLSRKQQQAHPQRVRHEKYGMGIVTEESEDRITVDFGELGTKSFMKDFVKLDRV